MAGVDLAKTPAGVAAEVLGITRQHLGALTRERVLEQSAKGKYDLAQTVQAYLAYTKRGKVPSEMGEARLGVEEEKLRRLRLENDEREQRSLPRGDVQVALNEASAIFASHAEALPSRLAGELAGMTDAGKIRHRLRDEVRKIRSAVADRFALLAAIPEGGRHRPAAAGPRARPVGGRKPRAAARKRRAGTVEVRADAVHHPADAGGSSGAT